MMIKVCGLKNREDILKCDSLGVDFLGFIFFDKSPRCVDPLIFKDLPDLKAKRVGVFVDKRPSEITKFIDLARLDYVQLHGDYSLEDCKFLGKERVIKVLWPERYSDFKKFQEEILMYKDVCSYFLIDSGLSLGGHGRPLVCSWIREIYFPKKWFLAGGIGPHNVLELIFKLNPDGVDINSSVELAPGKKDINAIVDVLNIVSRYSL